MLGFMNNNKIFYWRSLKLRGAIIFIYLWCVCSLNLKPQNINLGWPLNGLSTISMDGDK